MAINMPEIASSLQLKLHLQRHKAALRWLNSAVLAGSVLLLGDFNPNLPT
jgi:hypothetical protein